MKVVITDYEYQDVEKERKILEAAGIVLDECQCRTEQALIDACREADGVIVQYCAITERVIRAMERCRVIIKYGIGVNNIDVDAASAKGIYVCNVPDYGVDEVSNHAIAMMLALSRGLKSLNESLTSGAWGYAPVVPLHRMAGSTLGLVGLGRIPSLVAKKMAGFGLRILAYDPFARPEAARELGVELVEFDTLVAESDYISIHCPLTPRTQGLFGSETFRRMKSTAILVNTARGPVIQQQALEEALRTGELAGAGLDVYEQEPLPKDSPLLHMSNVICTPHCAWYTEEAVTAVQEKAAQEAANVLTGHAPWHAVNAAAVKQ